MQYLMCCDADISYEGGGGETAMHAAYDLGNVAMVCLLLNVDLNVEMRDSRWSETPFLRPASTGQTYVIVLGLELGAGSEATSFVERNALKLVDCSKRETMRPGRKYEIGFQDMGRSVATGRDLKR